MKPISIQLYSLREESKKDFVAVLRQVAEMGYSGVEPAGLHGLSPVEARRIVEDLGMVVSSNHGPWPNPDNLSEVIDVYLTDEPRLRGWLTHIRQEGKVQAGFLRKILRSGDPPPKTTDPMDRRSYVTGELADYIEH